MHPFSGRLVSWDPVSSYFQEEPMTASLQGFQDRKIDPNPERPIHCPYCAVTYLLAWDDKEWSSVKDWIRAAERAVRESHPRHEDVAQTVR